MPRRQSSSLSVYFRSDDEWLLPATINLDRRSSRVILEQFGFCILSRRFDYGAEKWLLVKVPPDWRALPQSEWPDVEEYWLFDAHGVPQLKLKHNTLWQSPWLEQTSCWLRWRHRLQQWWHRG